MDTEIGTQAVQAQSPACGPSPWGQVGTNRTSWVPAPRHPSFLSWLCAPSLGSPFPSAPNHSPGPAALIYEPLSAQGALSERKGVCESAHNHGDLIKIQAPCSGGCRSLARDITPSPTLSHTNGKVKVYYSHLTEAIMAPKG